MSTKTKIVIQLLALVWILLSVFVYLFTFQSAEKCRLREGCVTFGQKNWKVVINDRHRYYFEAFKTSVGLNTDKSHVFDPIIYIIVGLLFLYLANVFYEKFIEKKKKFDHKLSPFYLFLIFTFIFFFVYERWLNFYDLKDPIKNQGIFFRYPILLFQVSSICLLTLALGKKIIGLFFAKYLDSKDEITFFLLSFAFGLMPLIFLLFFMALFKALLFKYVLILFAIILILSIKEVWFWLKKFFDRNISIQANFFSPYIFLFLLILIFISHNFLELIRPLPIGFDDLTVYQNNPKLMAESGALLSGVMSHYFESFVSLGIVIFKSTNTSLLLAFTGSIFSLLAFYQVIKTYFLYRGYEIQKAATSAMLGSAIFYTLPMTVFQSSKDMKVDLMALFFTLMAFLCFWKWREQFQNSNRRFFSLLFISAFLAGFAAAIKYTNLLFLAVLIFYAFWILFKKYRFNIKKYLIILCFLLVALIPIAPMAIRNISQTKSLAPINIRFGKPANETFIINPPFNQSSGIEPDYQKYMQTKSSGNKEEVARYIGYDRRPKKYFLLPLRQTQNSIVGGQYVDIGFLFFAFVPLFFLFLRLILKKETNKLIPEVAIVTLSFWFLWLFVASGIIWYGISGFIFLILLLIEALDFIKVSLNRFFYFFVICIISIWLIGATLLRTTFLPEYNLLVDLIGLKYARGEIDKKGYIDNKFQPYVGIMDKINQDVEKNLDNPPKVYRVGTFYKYMITENDKTVLDDQLLDKFTYAHQDQDDQKMMERFKNSGIKYLIIDRNLMNIDSTKDKSLIAKGDKFLNFLKKNSGYLELLTDPSDDRLMIFKIL